VSLFSQQTPPKGTISSLHRGVWWCVHSGAHSQVSSALGGSLSCSNYAVFRCHSLCCQSQVFLSLVGQCPTVQL